nr:hypothetical protein [Tanacetum cinerariifolium]
GNNFNQQRGGNFNHSSFNQGQLYRPQVNQPPVYQAPVYQAPIPQTQRVSQLDFESYVKANDAILRNMQSQGTLPGNTVTTKRRLKGYHYPKWCSLSKTKSSFSVQKKTKVTKDQVQNPSSQNTAPVQPSVIQPEPQASVSEPVISPVNAPFPNVKPSIPYPSRRDN